MSVTSLTAANREFFSTDIITQSPEFQAVLNAAKIAASVNVNILILGESGTGKELLAQYIHAHSSRNNHPFVAVNCAALPENLVEAELFGYRKGAFTGANTDYLGRIQAAGNGTIFLDEVGELPKTTQAKLLRFLENGECQVLGSTSPVKVSVRIIAATNCNLYESVKCGKFREDLYYRLNIVPFELPPLKQRKGDIKLILHHYVHLLSSQYGLRPPTFSKSALNTLLQYDWPGNVRELRNFAERMVVFFPGQIIEDTNLPADFKLSHPKSEAHSIASILEKGMSLFDVEKQLLNEALLKTNGNQTHAARMLGMTRDTLLYRLKKYSLI